MQLLLWILFFVTRIRRGCIGYVFTIFPKAAWWSVVGLTPCPCTWALPLSPQGSGWSGCYTVAVTLRVVQHVRDCVTKSPVTHILKGLCVTSRTFSKACAWLTGLWGENDNHVRDVTHILKGLCVMSRTFSKVCARPLKCHAHFQKGLNYPGYTVSLVMDPGSFEGENCPLFLTIKYVGFITSLILWLLARISSTTGTYFHFLKQQFPLFRM
jgi:hypothetical protein